MQRLTVAEQYHKQRAHVGIVQEGEEVDERECRYGQSFAEVLPYRIPRSRWTVAHRRQQVGQEDREYNGHENGVNGA